MNDFEKKLLLFLKKKYHFDNFRPGQLEVLKELLENNNNVLAVLPTGTGKSLIYQISGQVLGGLTIIISPLLSLMQDQVGRLNADGIKNAVALNSMQSYKTKEFILNNLKSFSYLFISPETLSQESVLAAIKMQNVNLFVVDEAHSIVQWGPDFRPDYLNLGNVYNILNQPKLLLLTATANESIKNGMQKQFELKKPLTEIVYSVNRENIHLRTEILLDENQKNNRLITLANYLNGSGIVYVSSKKKAGELVNELQKKTNKNVAMYHGDVDNKERFTIQQLFMQNELDIIVATSAFGMGIDKQDVRWIIHYHLPGDMESYVQEIGRAGRDKKDAIAILLYVKNDEQLVNNLLTNGLPDSNTIDHFFENTPNYSFDEQHLRLLKHYQQNNLTADNVKRIFFKRLKFKKIALKKMVEYVYDDIDKRNFLITSFGEKNLSNDKSNNWSTQEIDIEDLKLSLLSTNKSIDVKQNNSWQELLKKMFNQ